MQSKTTSNTPNDATALNAASVNAKNKTSVRQLLDGKEYYVTKNDMIKRFVDHKYVIEKRTAYLHGIYQVLGCSRYTSDLIRLCTYLQLLPIDKTKFWDQRNSWLTFEVYSSTIRWLCTSIFRSMLQFFIRKYKVQLMVEDTTNTVSFRQACVILTIIIFLYRTYTVAVYANIPLQTF